MDTTQIRIWTKTLYAIIQAMSIAKKVNFGRLDDLPEHVEHACSWISPDCSYNSALLSHSKAARHVSFRRDPTEHFDEITTQILKMLVQDLTTIFDELMTDILRKNEAETSGYPLTKLQALKCHLKPEYEWAYQGCVELITCRNVLSHTQGKWTQRSIDQVKDFVDPAPLEGEHLSIGFSMLFRYRKAIRTFINEIEHALWPKIKKSKKKKKRNRSAHQKRREQKRLQRARGKEALEAQQTDK